MIHNVYIIYLSVCLFLSTSSREAWGEGTAHLPQEFFGKPNPSSPEKLKHGTSLASILMLNYIQFLQYITSGSAPLAINVTVSKRPGNLLEWGNWGHWLRGSASTTCWVLHSIPRQPSSNYLPSIAYMLRMLCKLLWAKCSQIPRSTCFETQCRKFNSFLHRYSI